MANSLRIDRLKSTYLVPRDHPDPERVRRELDDVARKYVIESLDRVLSACLDARDPSVWLIDKVKVDLLMDLSVAAPDEVAAFWATRMADSLMKTIARGEDGGVIHFTNRAEYLAYFLRDLASGRAWNSWYYEQFASLRSLPFSAAVCEALDREPELAEPVLLLLFRTNALGSFLKSLSLAGQERLLHICSGGEAAPGKDCFEPILAEWREAPLGSVNVLEFYLRVRNEHPGFSPGEVHGALRTVLTIEQWMRDSRLSQVLTAISERRLPDVLAELPPREQETALYLAFLCSENPEWATKIAAAVKTGEERVGARKRKTDDDEQSGSYDATPYGGVFLLLPTLLSSRELMAAFGEAEDRHLRYLLLLTCLGKNSKDALDDPALKLAAGLDESPAPKALQQTRTKKTLNRKEQQLLPGDVEYFEVANGFPLDTRLREELAVGAALIMRSFARSLPGLGTSSFDYLWRNVLGGDSRIKKVSGQILVELKPRPLQIVLRMAGLNERRLTPPWMPETEIIIRFEEQ